MAVRSVLFILFLVTNILYYYMGKRAPTNFVLLALYKNKKVKYLNGCFHLYPLQFVLITRKKILYLIFLFI